MEDYDFDAMCEAGDNLRKARREGTIADQRISPVVVHSNCDPGDENDYVLIKPWGEMTGHEKIEAYVEARGVI